MFVRFGFGAQAQNCGELTAFAELALYRYIAAHGFHKVFCDCKTEPQPVYAAQRGVVLALKRLEYAVERVLGYAYAVVFDCKVESDEFARFVACFFGHRDYYVPACFGVLDGIADDVVKHLREFVAVGIHVCVFDRIRMQSERDIFLRGGVYGRGVYVAHKVENIARFFIDGIVLRFHVRNFQDFVYQFENLIACRFYLIKISASGFAFIRVLFGERDVAENRVERGAHVVRHVGQKSIFCDLGNLCVVERDFEKLFLLHLL